MSSSDASTPSSASLSASPSSTSVPAVNDSRLSAVIGILAVIGVLLLALIGFLTFRVRQRSSQKSGTTGPFHGTSIWEREHPAAQITPFGAPRNVPRFNHTPGADMRIAVRRPDGAWHFADSRTPFKPAGVSDLDNIPSPSPVFTPSSFFPSSPRYNPSLNSSTGSFGLYGDKPLSTREQESNAMKLAAAQPRSCMADGEWGTDDSIRTTPPPPTYQRNRRDDS